MTQITVASGKTIDLRAIEPHKLCVRDMAYALSNINRFNGHSLRPISVAEHSLMVADIMERHFSVRDAAALLAALLHDGHEYLIGDVPSPIKPLLGDAWAVLEASTQRQLLKHFGVWTAFNTYKAWIHDADMLALTSEREQLMHPDAGYWPCQATHPAIDWVRYGDASQFTPDDWRQAFIDRFNELRFSLTLQQEMAKGQGGTGQGDHFNQESQA
jgi:hypothetical protein